MTKPGYTDRVFINCPFDPDYLSLLRAATFTVYRCGFVPITSLNEDNGTVQRIEKIEAIIESCMYGIHDISRVQLNPNGLPRFNMPFELGLFLGAKRYGTNNQRKK